MEQNNADFFESRLREAESLIRNGYTESSFSLLSEIRDYPSINAKTRLYVDFLMGKVFYLALRYEDASRQFESVLLSSEKLYGKNHSFTLLALGFLARAKSHQGEHREAAILYLRESFDRTGRSPMDIQMISDSYELYCREKESCYKYGN